MTLIDRVMDIQEKEASCLPLCVIFLLLVVIGVYVSEARASCGSYAIEPTNCLCFLIPQALFRMKTNRCVLITCN